MTICVMFFGGMFRKSWVSVTKLMNKSYTNVRALVDEDIFGNAYTSST